MRGKVRYRRVERVECPPERPEEGLRLGGALPGSLLVRKQLLAAGEIRTQETRPRVWPDI